MLSRVAERIYWSSRYIERVECTVRMLSIYDNLLFDLPRNVVLSWYNLIKINSLEKDFAERYTVQDERNVVKFMLGDDTNPSSVISSLHWLRENIRTTRDMMLEETWELTNELSIYVQENLKKGINRSQRHEFLNEIIKGCLQIQGLLYSNMPTDAPWLFLKLGRYLERADMTTRNLDAGVAAIMETKEDEFAVNSRQIILGNVLRSLNADQAYRRLTKAAVHSRDVMDFLVESPVLPRALNHCLANMIDSAEQLPCSEPLLQELYATREQVLNNANYDRIDNQFRDYLNDVQLALNHLHLTISATWFPQPE
ncbi:alpha-E domain-containing protein [Neiella sp. HB171785]|uniref:Alpha-E domain-containing protein n=2 Tax=Neiella litorisoli TaxID=2771431 RepID=A0A8J6QU89_9GAMM|nr:alpha-E domain-containing protein [Neiella litorisoli]